jgi:hypothetical protein
MIRGHLANVSHCPDTSRGTEVNNKAGSCNMNSNVECCASNLELLELSPDNGRASHLLKVPVA